MSLAALEKWLGWGRWASQDEVESPSLSVRCACLLFLDYGTQDEHTHRVSASLNPLQEVRLAKKRTGEAKDCCYLRKQIVVGA